MKKYEFCKAIGKYRLQTLRDNFGIDIQNLDISENFKDQKYIKAEMENDMFLFFRNNSLLGMLIGNERKKKFNEFDSNYTEEFENYNDNRLIRNRKNYTNLSDYIIRIKKSDMKLPRKIYHRPTNENSLNNRLAEYKRNKYNSITHEQIQDMIQKVITKISTNIFNQLPAEYKRLKWYSVNSYAELLEAFSKDVADYIASYKTLTNKDYFRFESAKNDYDNNKVQIIKFYNKLCK